MAAASGAVAVLIRSVGTSNNRLAHTGGTRYREGVKKIPAAALSNPDADLLAAQVASGERAGKTGAKGSRPSIRRVASTWRSTAGSTTAKSCWRRCEFRPRKRPPIPSWRSPLSGAGGGDPASASAGPFRLRRL